MGAGVRLALRHAAPAARAGGGRRRRHAAGHRYPGRPPTAPVYPGDSVTIFVLPPGFRELEERLRGRGTEDEPAIADRLRRAREEARAYPEYDYLIVNADIGESISRLAAVVGAERQRVARLREGFAPWQN